MKLKHNKKRNTAFIYEVLIKELSKASMHNLQEKKNKTIKILKSFFSKDMPLKEELDIYHSFNDIEKIDKNIAQKIIFEARDQALRLEQEKIDASKTTIINLINKELGKDSWDTFVSDYKKMATVNQAIFSKLPPKKQVFLEQKLVELLTLDKKENKQFPTINKLTLKSFLKRFNEEYAGSLNESQKALLSKYITSYDDDGVDLKVFLYNEIDRLKNRLQEEKQKSSNNSPKLQLIIEKIENYSDKEIDRNMITEIIKIQSLVSELKDVSTT